MIALVEQWGMTLLTLTDPPCVIFDAEASDNTIVE